jgi:preprotein translocase subunit SecD
MVAEAISRRLGRIGRAKDTTDGQIAIEIYGHHDPADLETIKRRISSEGDLEFRITADPNRADIADIIKQAMTVPASEAAVVVDGKQVAEWVMYAPEEFGPAEVPDHRVVKRMAGETPQALVLIDPWNLDGSYLTSAAMGPDDRGGLAVHFTFNSRGAAYFGQLTGNNLPNPATNTFRYLGIILDKRMLSAPSINSRITDSGMISGGAMTDNEVESIVAVLSAGRLPRAVRFVSEQKLNVPPNLATNPKVAAIFVILAIGLAVLVLVGVIVLTMNRARPR